MSSLDYGIKECDVLIIGGGSGIISAVEAVKQDKLKIILASKGPVSQSGLTPTANGGTHVPVSIEKEFQDVIAAGNYINDQNLVLHLLKETRNCLQKLEMLDIPYVSIRANSACVPCIETLRKCRDIFRKKPNIELLEDVLVTSLLTSDGKISGVTALDLTTGKYFVIKAKAVIIATGGFTGELYPHTSNNPFGITTDATGTGHIMAYLAGAELIDMEMIQFAPLPANRECLHIRYFPEVWKGPYLNRNGEIIIEDSNVFPGGNYGYLCTQTLQKEVEKGNGPIYIDHRNIQTQVAGRGGPLVPIWEARRKLIKSQGIDPRENKIEILIGSHFGMGGIRVNEKTESTVPGLYATGEVMGGLHGAMRIPGYSLTQIIVFSFEAGMQAANYALNMQKTGQLSADHINMEKERLFKFLQPKSKPVSIIELKKRLQNLMQQHVFIFRDKYGLVEASREINALKEESSRIYVPDFKRFNLTWLRAIEFTLMIEAADIVVKSALAREESRGAHYRRDFPERDDEKWLKHTAVKLEAGLPKIFSAPITINRMKPEV